MADRGLFFLDAEGWLVGPESAPFPGETRILRAACRTLRAEASKNHSREPWLDLRFEREQRQTAVVLRPRTA